LRNAAIILLFRAGVPPARLHAWYYAGAPQATNGATTPVKECLEAR
jgi:hypothetical protein